MTMFPKPKDVSKREVLTDAKWRVRRWDVFVSATGDEGGASCMKCGARIEWRVEGASWGNFEVHHEEGRGLGGGKRDDREYIPGVEDQYEKYPFMPQSPEGMRRNLFALCISCHREEENQGCSGQLQWSNHAQTRPGAVRQNSLFEELAAAEELGNSKAAGSE